MPVLRRHMPEPAAQVLVLSISILLLSSVPLRAAVVAPPGFVDELVAGGLSAPTSFAFLPDGRVLVTEQATGAIRLVAGGALAPGSLVVVPGLTTGTERGLLSIAVDPRWPASPYVYAHYTRTGGIMQLVRFTATGDLSNPASTTLALGSLHVVLDGLADAAFNHNGGALRFGPGRLLYFSIGDDATGCAAQDSTSLKGCLLRLDVSALPEGAGGPPPRADLAPAGNPFAGSSNVAARLVYAYGLRNPFRFHVDPVTGLVYVGDVGQNTWEEISELRPGDNAGWPHREGFAWFTYPGCSEPGGAGSGVYTAPIEAYGHGDGVVVISAGVLRRGAGSSWPPAWEGNVFFADYSSGFLRMLAPDAGGWALASVPGQPNATDWATGLTTPVDFLWGPDGQLWWLSQSSGQLRRLRAVGAAAVGSPSPAGRLELTAAPNPSTAGVTFALTLPRAGEMRLTVLDVTGRIVAVADAGWREAGRSIAAWDGRRANGGIAPAGVYLARLELDGASITTRIVRAR